MRTRTHYLIENCSKIPIDILSKNGFFRYKNFICRLFPNEKKKMIELRVDTVNKSIEFRYTTIVGENNKKEKVVFRRDLDTTPCHFGGVKYWFLCLCGRRVRVLYKRPFDRYFACRKCLNLTYYSTSFNRRASKYNYYLDYVEEKIDNLSKKTKLEYYNGKPTRNFRHLVKLEREATISNIENYMRFAKRNF